RSPSSAAAAITNTVARARTGSLKRLTRPTCSNATKHGIFAAVPVIPGECPEAWEAHRAGVVDSLAPVGLMEVNLAERAALLLWRLQRLARFEAKTVAAEVVAVDVPALPQPESEFSRLNPPPRQQTRDEQ